MSTVSIRNTGVHAITIPALAVVAVVTQVPLVFTLILSFIRWIIVRPDQGITFVGLDNYVRLLTSGAFYHVVFNTAFMTVASLSLCTLLGIAFGLMLNRQFPGVNIVRTIVIAPFFIMDAVAGIIWRTLMLNSSFGINAFLTTLVGVEPVDFLGAHALATIVMLITWQWTPFFVLIILAGLQSISEEILDSGRVDGANWFQTLFSIRIPLIMHHIEVAILLGVIFILKVFGLIFVTTSGGPGIASSNLPYHVYRRAFLGWNVGEAAAIAVVTVVITLLVIVLLFRWFRRRFSEAPA
ncbi:MAG: sugar ABC transporter permease [Spirochaetales bacterium]|nr:sugar ABC transporter permease [Spirochaetales bacterium]